MIIGRPFRVDWRPEDTPEALKAAHLAEIDVTLRTRLHGLWLLRSGRQLSDVASQARPARWIKHPPGGPLLCSSRPLDRTIPAVRCHPPTLDGPADRLQREMSRIINCVPSHAHAFPQHLRQSSKKVVEAQE